MELVYLGLELVQSAAEYAASYRTGQVVLRQLDRALWVVEKTAKWAVPPPLDQDERPELIRPLPWVFFLWLLVTLRIIRESISLVNLIMGKPPLRSADVVTFIQSKRRYIRTLKYQGNRLMRSRAAPSRQESLYTRMRTLIEMTMCFRRPCANNNTARAANNEEVFVVKRKRNREPAPEERENTMERLIEKMMLDLDADSEDDSSYTLTNAASAKSDSEPPESDDARSVFSSGVNTFSSSTYKDVNTSESYITDTPTPSPTPAISTPQKTSKIPKTGSSTEKSPKSEVKSPPANGNQTFNDTTESFFEVNSEHLEETSPKTGSNTFLHKERSAAKKCQKIANGRSIESSQGKKKGTFEPWKEDIKGKNLSMTVGTMLHDYLLSP